MLEAEESLSHLSSFAATVLAPDAALESGGERWGEAEDGVVQGDIPSGVFFSVAQQPSLVRLDQDCKVGGGLARGGFDDVYAVGKPEVVLPAVLKVPAGPQCKVRAHLAVGQDRVVLLVWGDTSQLASRPDECW